MQGKEGNTSESTRNVTSAFIRVFADIHIYHVPLILLLLS